MKILLLVSCSLLLAGGVQTAVAETVSADTCLVRLLSTAPDTMTIGEMKAICEKTSGDSGGVPAADEYLPSASEDRLKVDEYNILSLKPFTIMAHKQNYILPGVFNFHGYSNEEYVKAYGSEYDGRGIKDAEVQFQLSIKTPLFVDMFGTDISLFGAYTVRSFWQMYTYDITPSGDAISSPFRETNHEPEIWIQSRPDFRIFGFRSVAALIGIVHQSNGQSLNLSRSWNRLYTMFIFEKGNFILGLRPWYRIPEDSDVDDNPDITDYLGHGQILIAYKRDNHVFTVMSRNHLESGFSKGAVELDWSFPLLGTPYLKGYVQYFSGYGESMIDYDRYVNRLGVGIIMTNLL
jgi:phospholipase A1/A2